MEQSSYFGYIGKKLGTKDRCVMTRPLSWLEKTVLLVIKIVVVDG